MWGESGNSAHQRRKAVTPNHRLGRDGEFACSQWFRTTVRRDNQIIRDGATLVEDAADVLETVGGFARCPAAAPPSFVAETAEPAEGDRSRFIDLLGRAAVTVDELIRQAELPHPAVQTMLLELELAGRIERHAGGKVSLVA